MSLPGQDGDREAGYAMAALLVALGVMAVLMSAALPVWRHDAQREKEEELVFRGQQYVRAIALYQAKTTALPVSVDALIQGHYLRKKYKDPITNDDFELISAANPNPGGVTGSTLPGGRGTPQTVGGGPPASTGQLGANSNPNGSTFGGTVPGGMLGVRSKSKDESIRLYLNRNHYNEWMFIYQPRGPGRGGAPGPQRGPGIPGRGGPNGPGRGGTGTFPIGPGGGPGRGGPDRGGPGGFGPPGGPGSFGPQGGPGGPVTNPGRRGGGG